jgi:hypothetical protein
MLVLPVVAMLALAGCQRYVFEQHVGTTTLTSSSSPKPKRELVTYEQTGAGPIDPETVCAHPVRTEVRENTRDILAAMFTLGTYRPYTLYVTCEN